MKYKGTQKYSSIIHLDTLLVFYVRSSDIRKPGRGFLQFKIFHYK